MIPLLGCMMRPGLSRVLLGQADPGCAAGEVDAPAVERHARIGGVACRGTQPLRERSAEALAGVGAQYSALGLARDAPAPDAEHVEGRTVTQELRLDALPERNVHFQVKSDGVGHTRCPLRWKALRNEQFPRAARTGRSSRGRAECRRRTAARRLAGARRPRRAGVPKNRSAGHARASTAATTLRSTAALCAPWLRREVAGIPPRSGSPEAGASCAGAAIVPTLSAVPPKSACHVHRVPGSSCRG